MIFVLAITVIFIAISIYFFFRAEKLQRELIISKRDSIISRKENKALVDSMAIIVSRHEEFSKVRLKKIKSQILEKNNQVSVEKLEIITPAINNYGIIFRECLKGKGKLHAITKRCYENHEANSFKAFTTFINQREMPLKRMWSSNNLTGYISLVEALLLEQTDTKENKKAKS